MARGGGGGGSTASTSSPSAASAGGVGSGPRSNTHAAASAAKAAYADTADSRSVSGGDEPIRDNKDEWPPPLMTLSRPGTSRAHADVRSHVAASSPMSVSTGSSPVDEANSARITDNADGGASTGSSGSAAGSSPSSGGGGGSDGMTEGDDRKAVRPDGSCEM